MSKSWQISCWAWRQRLETLEGGARDSENSVIRFFLKSGIARSHHFVSKKDLTEALAARYEGLSQLSRSIASMTPDMLSRNHVALLRPMFLFDFASIVIFHGDADNPPWTSLGAEAIRFRLMGGKNREVGKVLTLAPLF